MTQRKARFLFGTFLLTALLSAAQAQTASRAACENEYKPKFGQRGKDVPWEPTSAVFAAEMLKLGRTTAADRVYDLGAGDGTIVIAAAKHFGATAVGIEYNPDLAKLGQCYIEAEGLAGKAKMIAGDIFKTDFSNATVVTMFLWPEVNMRLRPTLLKMAPGTRVVSHVHQMQNWKWDDEVELNGRRAYLWIIPANVENTWTFQEVGGSDSFVLALSQQFQKLGGKLQRDGKRSDIDGLMRGTQIILDLGAHGRLAGEAESTRITATVTNAQGERKYVGGKALSSR